MTPARDTEFQPQALLGVRHHVVEEEPDGATYFAPTDPVVIGETVACGFSPTSMDSLEVDASALDGWPGDEALADAVLSELRTDAATSELTIDVTVEDGVAYLRGSVPFVEDAVSAEEVAARLPYLAEVVDELDVTAL
jgi:hypothetical protein